LCGRQAELEELTIVKMCTLGFLLVMMSIIVVTMV